MRRRWQSALFKLTEIFTKPRVMRFPLKALFSWAGRQPLVMHKCICDAHTRFKTGQILEKGWTRAFHCQGVFRCKIVSGCVLLQDVRADQKKKLNFFSRKHLCLRAVVINHISQSELFMMFVSAFRLQKCWYIERKRLFFFFVIYDGIANYDEIGYCALHNNGSKKKNRNIM